MRGYDNPTLSQATAREDRPMWEPAIAEEMQQMKDEKVFSKKIFSRKTLPKSVNRVESMVMLTVKTRRLVMLTNTRLVL